MSLVVLSSSDQNPSNFKNFFNEGLSIGRDAEVCVHAYDCQLRLSGTIPTQFIITEGINDKMYIYHGDIGAGDGDQDIWYMPSPVIIPPGNYSPEALALKLDEQLNTYEYINCYMAWNVTWDAATKQFTIICNRQEFDPATFFTDPNPVPNRTWKNYNSGNSDGVAPILGTTYTRVTPDGPTQRFGFIDTRTTFNGPTSQAIGTILNPMGWEFRWNYQGVIGDHQFTAGLVPEKWINRFNANQEGIPERQHIDNFGLVRTRDLLFDGDEPITENDFAYTIGGNARAGIYAIGIKLSPRGSLLILQTNLNDINDTTITDLGVNMTANGNGLKKVMLCPRRNGADLVIEVIYDNGGGGWQVPFAPLFGISGWGTQEALYLNDNRYHAGVTWEQPNPGILFVQESVDISLPHWDAPEINPATQTEPLISTTAIWTTINGNLFPFTPNMEKSGFEIISQQCNIKDFLGFNEIITINTATMQSVGWVGEAIEPDNIEQEAAHSPLFVTCPTLGGVRGFFGAVDGNRGPILAMLRVGEAIDFAQSSHLADNWIKINNTSPLNLNHLHIVIKDEMNRDATILGPNTVIVLKFKSVAPPCAYKDTLVFGGNYSR